MKMQPVLLKQVTDQISRIPVHMIRESLVTLRIEYSEDDLRELGESIVDQGQLQTVVVQPGDDGYYDLVIGSRRLRATKLRGGVDIAAYVIEKRAVVELLLIALAENLHRSDLNPFEEAQGFLRLMKEFNLSLGEVVKGVNKSEQYITGRLQLLSMPEEVVRMVSDRTLPLRRIQTIARLPSGDDQVRLARLAVKHHLTQSELIAQVQREMDEPARKERNSYELTSVKLLARIDEISTFVRKVPRKMKIHRLNGAERQSLIRAIQKLEDEARSLRETISNNAVMTIPRSVPVGSASSAADNCGQEWTVKEVQRIMSPNRPSDEVLSVEMGRTVAAIRTMRTKASEMAG